MFKLIDRLLIRGYFKAYVICLVSLLSLYIVVDLFTNLDDFTHHGNGLAAVLKHIGSYYGYRVSQIFDRLCEAIVLLAAMFTVAWMQRNNELLPLLSAGVSTRRVVLPVLGSAFAMLSLTVVNQELVIPRIADYLLAGPRRPRRRQGGGRRSAASSRTASTSRATEATARTRAIKPFYCTIPENSPATWFTSVPPEATTSRRGTGRTRGGWLMTGTKPAQLEHWDNPGRPGQ